jgi:hypothetical protein
VDLRGAMNVNEPTRTTQTDDSNDEANDSLVVHGGVSDSIGISPTLVSAINSGQNYAYSSIVAQTRDERLKIAKLMCDKENGIDQLLNGNSFDVQDVILTKASFFDADGQQVTVPRCVLVSPTGETISIMARVWVTEFISTWLMIGDPPFVPALRVSAKQVKGTGANRYYTLVLP